MYVSNDCISLYAVSKYQHKKKMKDGQTRGEKKKTRKINQYFFINFKEFNFILNFFV